MLIKGLSLLFLGLGVFVLMQVALPYITFKAWEISAFSEDSLLVDPNPSSTIDSSVSVENDGDFPAFVVKNGKRTSVPYNEFKLSIPKIDLKSVRVMVNSNKFDDTLGHLPGSALPGEVGNIFITGHSSLPQNLMNKRAFFVNLLNIKKGDEIILTALGQNYRYVVEGLRVVDPKDVSVVNPPESKGRYLSLMTCVPPGFNFKRLIVLSRLKV